MHLHICNNNNNNNDDFLKDFFTRKYKICRGNGEKAKILEILERYDEIIIRYTKL